MNANLNRRSKIVVPNPPNFKLLQVLLKGLIIPSKSNDTLLTQITTSGATSDFLAIKNLIYEEKFLQDFFKTYYLVKKRKNKNIEYSTLKSKSFNPYSIDDFTFSEINYLILRENIERNTESTFCNTFYIAINAWLIIPLNQNK